MKNEIEINKLIQQATNCEYGYCKGCPYRTAGNDYDCMNEFIHDLSQALQGVQNDNDI